jgi:hypothetical protein
VAIDPVQLVKDQLEPVLTLDTTIEAAIPGQVEAQIALQGLDAGAITDQQRVYVSVLATYALIPRLLLKFAQKVKKAKGGSAEAEFHDASDFLKLLQGQLKDQIKAAAKETDPADAVEPYIGPSYPKPDVQGIS